MLLKEAKRILKEAGYEYHENTRSFKVKPATRAQRVKFMKELKRLLPESDGWDYFYTGAKFTWAKKFENAHYDTYVLVTSDDDSTVMVSYYWRDKSIHSDDSIKADNEIFSIDEPFEAAEKAEEFVKLLKRLCI